MHILIREQNPAIRHAHPPIRSDIDAAIELHHLH